jgi:hypothetical protein
MRGLATEIGQRSGTDLAYVRADWFIATATRPPLYNTLLRLPDNAGELERTLRVNVVDDFLRNKQARAGFTQSGVSSQNRVVDRHPAAYGAYWKTYDFSTTEGTGNVLQFPLGPVFVENPFPRQAFEHAGGEIIFSLPNGLHGYMLVNNKDKRIDAGPIDIVHDELATSGTPTIVAGLSCMGCHKHGMIRFKDDLRAGTAVSGEARLKLDQLIPVPENMDKLLKRDEDQFLRSLDEAAGGLLRAGDDSKKEIREFPEPVSAIARLYVKDLGAEEVALELGVPDAKKLAAMVEANRRLRELGLAPLVHEGRIKRAAWESLKGFLSPFQETARELELSTPFRVF